MKRTIVLSISDLHAGAGDLQDFTPEAEAFFEDCFANLRPPPKAELILVLNGDIFDFPQTRIDPASRYPEQPHPNIVLGCTEDESRRKLGWILTEHPRLFKTLRRLAEAGLRIVFLPGNHDADMLWPGLQRDFASALGLGGHALPELFPSSTAFEYPRRRPKLRVEHGHQMIHDGNNFGAHWPTAYGRGGRGPFRGTPARLYQPIGTVGILYVVNLLDRAVPIIDNVNPYSAARPLYEYVQARTPVRSGSVALLAAGAYVAPADLVLRLADRLFGSALKHSAPEALPLPLLPFPGLITRALWSGARRVFGALSERLRAHRLGEVARQRMKKKGLEAFICGHTHKAKIIAEDGERGPHYLNTGTWMPYLDLRKESLWQGNRWVFKTVRQMAFAPRMALVELVTESGQTRVTDTALIDLVGTAKDEWRSRLR